MSVFMFGRKKENASEEPTLTKEELREIKSTAVKYLSPAEQIREEIKHLYYAQERKYFRRQIWKFARRP